MLIFRTEDTWNRFSRYSNRLDKSRFNLSVNEERTQKEKKECDYHWLLVIHAASNKNDRSDLDVTAKQSVFLLKIGFWRCEASAWGVRWFYILTLITLHFYPRSKPFVWLRGFFFLGKNSGSKRSIFCRHFVLSYRKFLVIRYGIDINIMASGIYTSKPASNDFYHPSNPKQY